VCVYHCVCLCVCVKGGGVCAYDALRVCLSLCVCVCVSVCVRVTVHVPVLLLASSNALNPLGLGYSSNDNHYNLLIIVSVLGRLSTGSSLKISLYSFYQDIIRPSQTAAFPTFAG